MKKPHSAFTLIELMITVAIVAVLAAIAYPNYTNQALRSHRAEARNALLQVQVGQEKFFLQFNRYAGDSAGSATELNNAPTASSSPGLGITTNTPNSYYRVLLTAPTSTTYTATATAINSQLGDTACKVFRIDSTGARTAKKADTTANDVVCWR